MVKSKPENAGNRLFVKVAILNSFVSFLACSTKSHGRRKEIVSGGGGGGGGGT